MDPVMKKLVNEHMAGPQNEVKLFTIEEIDKEAWFGGQKERVTAMAKEIERLTALVTVLEVAVLERM